jgi:hypothetical protein
VKGGNDTKANERIFMKFDILPTKTYDLSKFDSIQTAMPDTVYEDVRQQMAEDL